jgi:hypothetical protein
VSAPEPTPGTWGTCSYCGVAVPAGATKCPICGAEGPVPAGEMGRAPKPVRRRIRLTATLRTLIVVAVAVGLVYTLVAAVLSGPPTVPDPLTTAATYTLAPGNFTVISGNITGGDYVQGNYTAVSPPGIEVAVAIYNSSEWSWFTNGTGSPGVQWNNTPDAEGAIVFAAPYTDTYYIVIANPLPEASGITLQVYVATTYESNVAEDGGI